MLMKSVSKMCVTREARFQGNFEQCKRAIAHQSFCATESQPHNVLIRRCSCLRAERMNKAGVAVAGFCCQSSKVELLQRISLDPFDDLLQNVGVQIAKGLAVLCSNAPVHQGEETRSEGMGQMLGIKGAGRST